VARELLRDFLECDPEIKVVGQAKNGRDAVELVQRLRPHLITMDLEMPVMDGMAAIEEIMATAAVPILVVSSVADAQKAFDAVSRGALEVIAKPDIGQASRAELIAKVRMLSRVKVIRHIRPSRPPSLATAAAMAALTSSPTPAKVEPVVVDPLAFQPMMRSNWRAGVIGCSGRVFAIASSTGGPQALSVILARLPPCFPCPIVIAQHISDGFAGGMADWLASLCGIKVQLARPDEPLQPGVAYLSPSERHLVVTAARRLSLLERADKDLYRPSCDRLLASVAEACGAEATGVILTGMGSDGAAGMARIRQAGGVTLGQDQASSAIYGMNRVAIERGAVMRVLSADRIAREMISLAGLPEQAW
jgi:two-component system chemotaxis response regulator CheB